MSAANFQTVATSEHTNEFRGYMPTVGDLSADVQNALVEQRNDVTAAIARATTLAELRDAEARLRLVANLWHALGYGYKTVSVRQWIVRRARELAHEERQEGAALPARQYAKRNDHATRAALLDAYANDL